MPVGPGVSGRVETGRWYEVRVLVRGPQISCRLDGKPLLEFNDQLPEVAASTVRNSETGDVIVKIVSRAEHAHNADINLPSLGSHTIRGRLTVLSGSALAVNRPGHPPSVIPRTDALDVSKTTRYSIPPHSLSVLRFNTGK